MSPKGRSVCEPARADAAGRAPRPAGPLLLALDPSSTRTGYAVMAAPTVIVEAGYLAPERTKDPVLLRIDAMVRGLDELLEAYTPHTVVVEIPSGRPGAGIKAGAGAQLAIYGMAVGEVRRACLERGAAVYVGVDEGDEYRVVAVTEREWTRGRTKAKRQREVAMLFPQYAAAASRDGGADVSDAIQIGLWWFRWGDAEQS